MIEEYLLQYGVLGLWTISLIIEKTTTNKNMMAIMREVRDLLKKKGL